MQVTLTSCTVSVCRSYAGSCTMAIVVDITCAFRLASAVKDAILSNRGSAALHAWVLSRPGTHYLLSVSASTQYTTQAPSVASSTLADLETPSKEVGASQGWWVLIAGLGILGCGALGAIGVHIWKTLSPVSWNNAVQMAVQEAHATPTDLATFSL